jgi:hypothetical protein
MLPGVSRKSAAPGAVTAKGAGPPLPFASSRPHPFRSLVQLAPGEPAYGLGVRMAILITVPKIVGAAVHDRTGDSCLDGNPEQRRSGAPLADPWQHGFHAAPKPRLRCRLCV